VGGSLLRSETSFAVEFRILLFAGLLWGAVWITRGCVQPWQSCLCACFTMPVLDQADSLRRLVILYGDSDVSLYFYPCSTLLGGILGQAPRYRLSSPLHPIDNQSHEWGKCFTLAPRGQESHLHDVSVIQDRFIYLLSLSRSPSLVEPFQGNGSQPRQV
jgi:hypothetical protein